MEETLTKVIIIDNNSTQESHILLNESQIRLLEWLDYQDWLDQYATYQILSNEAIFTKI